MSIDKDVHFSDLLKMYRRRLKFSQNKLASLLGFTTARTIQNWEGNILPGPDNLAKIIELFIEQHGFIAGKELEEASQLWAVVKNDFDNRFYEGKSYQLLDKAWLERLLREKASSATHEPEKGQLTPVQPSTTFQPKHNLPFYLTSFVGRTSQIQQITEILETKARFLTLIGPGGIGKTRLAVEVARRLLELRKFEDGLWLVELAAVTEGELVAQTIVQSLGLGDEPNRSALATLTDYFKTKRALLILDNCEQLNGEYASLIYQLLKACPGLHVMATSRMPLGLQGEYHWQVSPLALPELDDQGTATTPDFASYEAIQLFTERARTTWLEFSVQDRNLKALWELCRYLDGMPLAIELAAAWVNTLSLEQITQKLQESIQLLKTNNQVLIPPRQQTMRAAIDWSYRLLSQSEQSLLKQLAIFAGGCTEEAVKAVCQINIDQNQVLELVKALVDKSLVVVDRQYTPKLGVVRWRLLETVRQYSLEQLDQEQL